MDFGVIKVKGLHVMLDGNKDLSLEVKSIKLSTYFYSVAASITKIISWLTLESGCGVQRTGDWVSVLRDLKPKTPLFCSLNIISFVWLALARGIQYSTAILELKGWQVEDDKTVQSYKTGAWRLFPQKLQ